jgi:cephalosporin hydroxylase
MEWRSAHDMRVGKVNFWLSTNDFTRKTSNDSVVLLKNRTILEAYVSLLAGTETHNILEFGTFEGGSPIFFAEASDANRIVGIDIRDDGDNIREYEENYADRLKLFYGISQSDGDKVREIIDENFKGPLDLVIDDASHLYGQTKAAFDIAFPRLRVGGLYVIEDWNWAHYSDQSWDFKWKNKRALTNLAFEIVMAIGSGGTIAAMDVQRWALIITKGSETPPGFSLRGAIRLGEHRRFHKI